MNSKLTISRTRKAINDIEGYEASMSFFKQNATVRGLSNTTIINYTRMITNAILYFKKLPEKINENELNTYLFHLIKNDRGTQKSAFKQLVYGLRLYYKIVRIDINFRLPSIKHEKRLPMVLSKEECKKLIQLTTNVKHRLIIKLMYGCGLRLSELKNLKWSDIDIDRMMILIKQSKSKKDRYVPFSNQILDDLMQYTKQQLTSEYVFSGVDPNGKMSSKGIGFIMQQAVKRAEISKKGVCLHTLRHCYACHLLEDGLDIVSIMELLGHSSIETTMVYLQVVNIPKHKKYSPIDTLFDELCDIDKNRLKQKFYELQVKRKLVLRSNGNQLSMFAVH